MSDDDLMAWVESRHEARIAAEQDKHGFPFGFPHRAKPLGLYPQPAPFTPGSKFVDTDYPDHKPFTVYKHGSSFGDDYLLDIAQQWHEPHHCRVVDYLSPEALKQRKQDRILDRLMRTYFLDEISDLTERTGGYDNDPF